MVGSAGVVLAAAGVSGTSWVATGAVVGSMSVLGVVNGLVGGAGFSGAPHAQSGGRRGR